MQIVLLGAPASGKGTQATVLAARFGVPKISTGDMLRDARAQGTDLGKQAEEFMKRGQLVPDDVVIGLVEQRLAQPAAKNGFIFDGFPRTVAQAEALDALTGERGQPIEHAVLIDVAKDLLVERATLRRLDRRTGQIYHLKYSPPPPDAELEQRADDREETVIERLGVYEAQTAALLPHYQRRGLLRRVDGVGSPDEVTARILQAVSTN